jgi:hypothetical protein
MSQPSSQWQAWFDEICRKHAIRPVSPTGKFQPDPNDAFKLAALQWWAFTIGQVAIETYATDRRQYARISKVLSDATVALRALAGDNRPKALDAILCETTAECPDGWVCDAGTCEPEFAPPSPSYKQS